MRRLVGAVAVLTVLAFGTAASAAPITWVFNFADAGAVEGAVLSNPPAINEVTYKAETYTFFKASGGAGDEFFGLSIVQPSGFNLSGTSKMLDFFLGGYLINHEVTGLLAYKGVQGTPDISGNQTFTITGAVLALYFDAGSPYTMSNFNTPSTFADGTKVEAGSGAGAGSNDSTIGHGGSKIFLTMTDLLSGLGDFDPFELAKDGVIDFAIAASDNDICGSASTCGSATAASFLALFAAEFGAGFGLGIDPAAFAGLVLHTGADGSFTKEAVVPAPMPLLLLGLGVVAVAAVRRRTR